MVILLGEELGILLLLYVTIVEYLCDKKVFKFILN